ncbi:MAG TPA: TIGR03086 family metal-binding protein [Acidimicrobiales bacterium]|nr:TIGR03086 family metal-binding protein [Acidimicrobiales bacterium]
MEPIDQLSYILPTVSMTVGHIVPSQLTAATPCSEFRVQDLLDHLMVGGDMFAARFRGEEATPNGHDPVDGVVPAAAFRTTMEGLLASVKSPGAMERTISAPIGEVPGSVMARFAAFDVLMHGWDLAQATDQPYELPPVVVAAVDEFARTALTPEMRDGDTFKDETTPPDDASQLERLVAFSGRSL